MLTPFTLTAAIQAMGVAQVFVGDALTAVGGMLVLGATEGEISVNIPQDMNPLTAPELTGGVVHQSTTTLGAVTVTVPLILSDMSVLTKISPTGTASGGYSTPQKVAETTVLILPLNQLGGGLTKAAVGTAWSRTAGNGVAASAAAPPTNAVWLWRATPSFASLPFAYGNGGKVIVSVTFTAMFDGTKPEGHKVYTIGDPYDAVPTPINVLV